MHLLDQPVSVPVHRLVRWQLREDLNQFSDGHRPILPDAGISTPRAVWAAAADVAALLVSVLVQFHRSPAARSISLRSASICSATTASSSCTMRRILPSSGSGSSTGSPRRMHSAYGSPEALRFS